MSVRYQLWRNKLKSMQIPKGFVTNINRIQTEVKMLYIQTNRKAYITLFMDSKNTENTQ